MAGWIGRIFGSGQRGEGAAVSAAQKKALRAALAKLDLIKSGYADRAASYVLTGEDESVVAELTGKSVPPQHPQVQGIPAYAVAMMRQDPAAAALFAEPL